MDSEVIKEVPIEVTIIDTGETYSIPKQTRVNKLLRMSKVTKPYRIMGAHLNGRLVELNYRIKENCSIRFMDYSDLDAMRMYRRGLSFVLIKAAKKVFPRNDLLIRYYISEGLYCSFRDGTPVLSQKDLFKLKEEMERIVKAAIPFQRKEISTPDAITLFDKLKMHDKVRFFKYYNKEVTHVYYLDDMVNYFFGYLPPDTSYVDLFEFELMSPGFVLRFPLHYSPDKILPFRHQVKLVDVFREYESWAKILEIEDVGSVNKLIAEKKDSELIQIAEAMHEKKISSIADRITHNFHRLRVVLVAGPSSSGKTTFTKRLALHLKANGLRLEQISLDNYFLDRDFSPKDEKGEFNFEILEALDIEVFNEHLRDLIAGKKIELPRYDFGTGKKSASGKKIKIDRDQLILIEGIHGLNDKLTYAIPQDKKFKIYISPMTHLNFDNNNVVSSTDLRLIRRLVRDNFFRDYPPEQTMEMWPKVRRGERENIFIFLDDADALFNSSLVYEMAALKSFVEPQLKAIGRDSPYYVEARRLLNFTSCFL